MEEDKIFELFNKYQDQFNEWDGHSIGYTNFKKAINEALMSHIVNQQHKRYHIDEIGQFNTSDKSTLEILRQLPMCKTSAVNKNPLVCDDWRADEN